MALIEEIKHTFGFFIDSKGKPLENGKIYIGKPGLEPSSNPTQVYSDQSLTQSVSQPIRTIAGYPVVGSTFSPIKLYSSEVGGYSILVTDKNDNYVYSKLIEVSEASPIALGVVDPTVTGVAAPLHAEGYTNETPPRYFKKNGLGDMDWVLILPIIALGVADPTVTGVAAPLNTRGYTNETPPRHFSKDGAANTDWTFELKQNPGDPSLDADVQKLDGYHASRLYDGTPSQREFFLQKLADIKSGSTKNINVVQIGDSLVSNTSNEIAKKHLQKWFPSPELVVGLVDGAGPQGSVDGGFGLNTNSEGGIAFSKTQYDNIFTGTGVIVNGSSTSTVISYNGVFASMADRLVIPILTNPGAGFAKIEVWDNPSQNYRNPTAGEITSSHTLTGLELIIDANAAYGASVVVLDFASTTQTRVRVTHQSGGDVKIGPVGSQRLVDPCINVYKLFAGSNQFRNETSTGATATASILGAYEPHLITVHSDDGPTDYENFMPLLKTAIDGANLAYTPLVVLIGATPKQNSQYQPGGDQDLVAANKVLRKYAAQYGWYFYDGFNLAETYGILTELGFQGDGVHPPDACGEAIAQRIAKDSGIEYTPDYLDTMDQNSRDIPTIKGVRDFYDAKVFQKVQKPLVVFGGEGESGAITGVNFTGYSQFSLSYAGTITGASVTGDRKTIIGNCRGVANLTAGTMSLATDASGSINFRNEQTTTTLAETAPINVGANTLFLVTATVDVTTGAVKVYINGSLVTDETIGALTNTSSQDITIMRGNDSARWVSGEASYFGLHSAILTDSQVADLHFSGGVKLFGNEVFSYLCSEGAGFQLRDSSSNGSDILITDNVSWLDGGDTHYVEDLNINASSSNVFILSSSQGVLPSNAFITRIVVNDSSGSANTGLVVQRSDGVSTHESISASFNVGANKGIIVMPNLDQNLSLNNIRIAQAATGGTNLSFKIYYTVF